MKKRKCFAAIVITICVLTLLCGCGKALHRPADFNVDDSNKLSWTAVDGARSYKVEIKNVDSGETTQQTTRKSSISLSDLEEGDYEIAVKAVSGKTSVKDSNWSQKFSFHQDYISGCVYKLINNNAEYMVEKAKAATGVVLIGDTYRGKPITVIGEDAFKSNRNIESVIIGKYVKSIGESAFYNCSSLTSITIPESVTTIGVSAFQGCSALKSIKIPDGVTTIDKYTFIYCRSLEEVIMGSGVTDINEAAFSECIALTSFVIPDTVTRIGNEVFALNENMTSVTIGSGVTKLGNKAFFRCSALKDVTFGQNSRLAFIGEMTFSECTALDSFPFPDGLTSVGRSAFYSASELDNVSLPDSVTTVGAFAFDGTKLYHNASEAGESFIYADQWLVAYAGKKIELKEITADSLKSDVVGIADQVFHGFENLETITFPRSLRYIGKNAFYDDKLLYKVIIPENSVETIGSQAFYGCTTLQNVSLGKGLKTIGPYAFYKCSVLNNNADRSIIPDTVTSIGTYAFNKTKLWNNPDSNGIVYAGNWVVGFVGDITNVILKADTVGIANYAFYQCATLTNITGEGISNVKYLGIGAFLGCERLAALTLNENLEKIEDYTFYKCLSLYRVNLPGNLKSIGRSAFYQCETLNELDLSGTLVETISHYAFYQCINMKTINLGKHLKSMGQSAFYGCSALKSIVIPNNVETIGALAFYKCENVEALSIGSGVGVIGTFAFGGCTALLNIEIPSSVKVVGSFAFYKCGAVAQLTINEGVTVIGAYAFYGLDKLTKLVLPSSVTNIGDFAFKGCSGLSFIFIDSRIAQIGAHAFYGCGQTTIYTDAAAVQEGWNLRFNSSFRPVVLNCVMSEDGSYVVSVAVKDGSVLNPEAVGVIVAPERDGYIFKGWATDSVSMLVAYTAADIADVPAGTALYAVWEVPEAE